MAYKQTMGKGPAMKTGAGIPKELMSGPAMHEGVVHEGKKPKGTTTRTQEKVTQGNQTGTLTTWTTKTPGSGGDSLSGEIIRTPEGDAAYEAKTPAERSAQNAKFKALNPPVPGSTNIQSRFLADPIATSMKPMGITPGDIKAEGIKQGIKFTPPAEKKKYTPPKQGLIDWIGEAASDVGQALTPSRDYRGWQKTGRGPKRKMGRGMKRTLGTHIGNFFRSCKGGC